MKATTAIGLVALAGFFSAISSFGESPSASTFFLTKSTPGQPKQAVRTGKGLPSNESWTQLHTLTTSSESRTYINDETGEVVQFNPQKEYVYLSKVTGKHEVAQEEPIFAEVIPDPIPLEKNIPKKSGSPERYVAEDSLPTFEERAERQIEPKKGSTPERYVAEDSLPTFEERAERQIEPKKSSTPERYVAEDNLPTFEERAEPAPRATPAPNNLQKQIENGFDTAGRILQNNTRRSKPSPPSSSNTGPSKVSPSAPQPPPRPTGAATATPNMPRSNSSGMSGPKFGK